MKITSRLSVSLVLSIGLTVINSVQVAAVATEFSIKQEPAGDVAIYIDDQLFTRYVTSDTVTNKCYFWPIIGPGGIKMTRAYPMEESRVRSKIIRIIGQSVLGFTVPMGSIHGTKF